ncbi:protein of unknown function [Pararobbsia alpina]
MKYLRGDLLLFDALRLEAGLLVTVEIAYCVLSSSRASELIFMAVGGPIEAGGVDRCAVVM